MFVCLKQQTQNVQGFLNQLLNIKLFWWAHKVLMYGRDLKPVLVQISYVISKAVKI